MKRNVFFAAIAATALALGSCSQDEVIESNEVLSDKQAISFNTYWGRPQVAGRAESSAWEDNGMAIGVYAYRQANEGGTVWAVTEKPNLMVNAQLSNATGSWVCTPTAYWSNDAEDVYTFFAYAPYSSSATWTVPGSDVTDGHPTITFEHDGTSDKNDDIRIAQMKSGKRADNVNTDGNVALAFKHALSQISSVTIKNDLNLNDGDGGTDEFIVNSLSIGGFYIKGDLLMDLATDGTPTWQNVVKGDDANAAGRTITFSIEDNECETPYMVVPATTAMNVTIGYTLKINGIKIGDFTASGTVNHTFVGAKSYALTFTVKPKGGASDGDDDNNAPQPITFTATVAAWESGNDATGSID